MENNKGYIQIYTGNGKGKTTCALGLSLRAVCAGQKVFFGQFVKGMKYSELDAIKYLPGFKMKQYGRDCFIFNKPSQEDIDIAKEGLKEIENILKSEEYDIVVLDELNIAIYYNLVSLEEVIDILKNKNEKIEVIITGRYAREELINLADLVTEMKEVKHYYKKGVEARVGIEK
ncbi:MULTISPECIES: cob(I)yrinic acid a,c-diamide adenosyltransferase [Clostridium]|uniref:Cob(I)alamin adenosyltransferase n=1 Tax=Clostridium novyi (strain NT) TaxID=386415 RepID=A0Q2J6_CLONN|nr:MULTISPECIES: cob(I)yrinic acid a,c-diamide adenosyltransferase [Clostridium]ABK62411.1 cob(I)alamin adenosyltransferase [Clostridium novyi NT]KEH85979.1 cobinamide adenolsyltransferase [Clostridium novyi A str. 4540]KEH86395.1 cobinamide adenolsyltransferase [Clostridium novyi A str. NCTC 538]KEH90360.1 cobinamide adenolsyltransferase [Clostridium novyi A str. BKT29909]KEH91978.1 cobinamide adenolsyltransferase [Clostridium novyi A str. GD211209]